MDGQMSLFDFIEKPADDIETKEPAKDMRQVMSLKPLLGEKQCERHHDKLCDRWSATEADKADLPKGFACAGCCWFCHEAPQHGGKCHFECRKDKI